MRIGRDIDTGKLVPVIDLRCAGKIGGKHQISVSKVRGGARAGVTCLPIGRMLEIDADNEVAAGRHGIFERIGKKLGAGGDGHIGAAMKSERPVGCGVNHGGRRRDRTRDMDGIQMQGRRTESV